jgi:hypothetical protein
VNTDPYERHLDRSLDASEPAHELAESEVSTIARHVDPSIRSTGSTAAQKPASSSIAWVRPSELPAVVASRFVVRGIDLQAELNRRAQHAPRSAALVTRRTIARPSPSTPTRDRGIEL